jgi:hypothetical protein
MSLILLDTRRRVSGTPADFVIDLPVSVTASRLSLTYADVIPPDQWAHGAIIVEIEGVPNGVSYTRGGSGIQTLAGFGTFIIPTGIKHDLKHVFRENSEFPQIVVLKPPQRFARMTVRLLGSDGVLAPIVEESLFILRVE